MDFEPKILGIACNWCTYTGADLAGTTRLKYPQNVRTVRVMCSSRINPSFIIRAFQLGADGVLVGGCHPGRLPLRNGESVCPEEIGGYPADSGICRHGPEAVPCRVDLRFGRE